MSDALNFLLLSVVLLAPFALVATLASRAHRGGYLRWHTDQFRFAAPMAGRLSKTTPTCAARNTMSTRSAPASSASRAGRSQACAASVAKKPSTASR